MIVITHLLPESLKVKKLSARDVLVLSIAHLLFAAVFRRSLAAALQERVGELKTNPCRVVANIITGFIVGQAVFWRLGSDQLGLFMDPKIQFGQGQKIGTWVYENLPQTRTASWMLKFLEVGSDELRTQTEIWTYNRLGYCPDALAVLLTPQLWHIFEIPEKLVGAIRRPERVLSREGTILSAQNTYGNLFRIAQVGVLAVFGTWISRHVRNRVENGLHILVRKQ